MPRASGTDLGRQALQLKLIGTLIHSHVLVLHLVAPHLPDDANLVCHVLDESIEEVLRVRESKSLKPCVVRARFALSLRAKPRVVAVS